MGHVQISAAGFDGTQKIPVFGVSNPITSVAGLADTYNYQGFGCGTKSGGNVLGIFGCASHYGTLMIDTAGNFTKCKGGDISVPAPTCTSTRTGVITATSTPGVYDFVTSTNHSGWFFAFTAPNGQKVAVIDHDDAINSSYGHSVASTQASVTAGAVDGNYFVKDNQGNQRLLTVTGTGFTNNTNGNTGTLAYNSPWNGMVTHTRTSSFTPDGVVMIAGTGAFTGISLGSALGDTQRFIIGMKY